MDSPKKISLDCMDFFCYLLGLHWFILQLENSKSFITPKYLKLQMCIGRFIPLPYQSSLSIYHFSSEKVHSTSLNYYASPIYLCQLDNRIFRLLQLLKPSNLPLWPVLESSFAWHGVMSITIEVNQSSTKYFFLE